MRARIKPWPLNLVESFQLYKSEFDRLSYQKFKKVFPVRKSVNAITMARHLVYYSELDSKGLGCIGQNLVIRF